MSSTLCQGLQSSLETSRLFQQRALCLGSVSPKPHIFKQADQPHHTISTGAGSDPHTKPQTPTKKCITEEAADQTGSSAFSSITSLRGDVIPKETKYIHPLSKRPCSSMSEKSLELCTESLGSETGTGNIIMEKNCAFLAPSNSIEESEIVPLQMEGRRWVSKQASLQKKSKCKEAFPPPLTSIAGGSCIQVRPHREDGRLVIKTIAAPSSLSCLQAERREGRLLLRFLNKSSGSSTTTPATACSNMEEEPTQEEYYEINGGDEVMGCVNGNESSGDGVEMGVGKIQRPRRCSDRGNGNKGMLVSKSYWVASS